MTLPLLLFTSTHASYQLLKQSFSKLVEYTSYNTLISKRELHVEPEPERLSFDMYPASVKVKVNVHTSCGVLEYDSWGRLVRNSWSVVFCNLKSFS